jgi:cytochrome P450
MALAMASDNRAACAAAATCGRALHASQRVPRCAAPLTPAALLGTRRHTAPARPRAARATAAHGGGSEERAGGEAGGGGDAAGGGCPVLRAPRYVRRGWRRELSFGADPAAVQDEILRGDGLAEGNWMTMRALFVGDASLARAVLATQADAFAVSNPPHFKHILGPTNLGLLDEPAHGQLRALLAPAFTSEAVDALLPRVAALCHRAVDAWAAAGEVAAWQRAIKLLTLEIMADVVGGFQLSPEALGRLSDDFEAIVRGMAFPIPVRLFGLTPFGRGMKARRRVEALLRAQCDAYRAAAAAQPGAATTTAAPSSLLQRMLAACDPATGAALTEQQLNDNFIGLLIAGHDTTASSLGVALLYLAQTPDALAALRAEQAAVVRAHGAAITPAALAAMPLTEGVLREAWRLHPVVPVVGRAATRDVTIGDYAVRAGQRTFVALNTVTRGAATWASVAAAADSTSMPPLTEFAPQRWLPGAPGAAAAAAAQLPFGAGKRACLGAALAWAEGKTLLALVARRLSFQVDPATVTWTAFPFPVVAMDARCAPLTEQL